MNPKIKTFEEILIDYPLSVNNFIEDKILDEMLYQELYTYYAIKNAIPYAALKATTLDPYEVISKMFAEDVQESFIFNNKSKGKYDARN
jgi:replication initiation and membrane attachment protein DnaB